MLDHIANELETRLVVPKDRFLAEYLISSKLTSLTPERELQVFMPFAGHLPDNNFAAYKAEMVRWKCKWQNATEKPSTLIDTLKHAKPELYPNIHRAIKVLLTMSVTMSATAERYFSALKSIKTYLRSTMVEGRLNGLSLLHVHLEILPCYPYLFQSLVCFIIFVVIRILSRLFDLHYLFIPRVLVFSCSMQSQLNWIVISMYIRIANMLYIFQIKCI